MVDQIGYTLGNFLFNQLPADEGVGGVSRSHQAMSKLAGTGLCDSARVRAALCELDQYGALGLHRSGCIVLEDAVGIISRLCMLLPLTQRINVFQ